jgi:hypothetical protein
MDLVHSHRDEGSPAQEVADGIGGFTTHRAWRSLAIKLLAVGVVSVVVVGAILALIRPVVPATRDDPSPTVTVPEGPTRFAGPPQTTVPLDIIEQLNLGPRAVSAMSVNPGVVWLATQGVTNGVTGTLIRVDATTAHKTAGWTIGGDPVAIAARGQFVWVANGHGDGPRTLPGQNTVEQFNAATGALVHVYRVLDPRGLVANPTSALVISANPGQQTAISLLSAGNATAVTTLPGTLQAPVSWLSPEVALAVCPDRVFVALSSELASGANVTIYAMQASGAAVRRVATIPSDYAASMACDTTSLFLIGAAGNGNTSIARVSVADGRVTNLWEGPYPVAVAFLSGRVWITYSDDALNESVLTSLDPATGIAASTRSVVPAPPTSGDPSLLIPGDSGLWLVASLGSSLLHIAAG